MEHANTVNPTRLFRNRSGDLRVDGERKKGEDGCLEIESFGTVVVAEERAGIPEWKLIEFILRKLKGKSVEFTYWYGRETVSSRQDTGERLWLGGGDGEETRR